MLIFYLCTVEVARIQRWCGGYDDAMVGAKTAVSGHSSAYSANGKRLRPSIQVSRSCWSTLLKVKIYKRRKFSVILFYYKKVDWISYFSVISYQLYYNSSYSNRYVIYRDTQVICTPAISTDLAKPGVYFREFYFSLKITFFYIAMYPVPIESLICQRHIISGFVDALAGHN